MQDVIIKCWKCNYQFYILKGYLLTILNSEFIIQCPVCVAKNTIKLESLNFNKYKEIMQIKGELFEPRVLPETPDEDLAFALKTETNNAIIVPEEINVSGEYIILRFAIYPKINSENVSDILMGDLRIASEKIMLNYLLFDQNIEEFNFVSIKESKMNQTHLEDILIKTIKIEKTYLNDRSYILSGQSP